MSGAVLPGSKVARALRIVVARLGIVLVDWSGVFRSFFGDWRWALFDFAERRDLHVMPVHYYSPIPKIKSSQGACRERRYLAVEDGCLDASLASLRELHARFCDAFDEIARAPTEAMIARRGLPSGMPPISRSRPSFSTVSSARTGQGGSSKWAAVIRPF